MYITQALFYRISQKDYKSALKQICAENLAMSHTRMRTRNSADEMGSGEKFDAIQYVKDNYDDYEDGWGLNLMNLKEVTGQEMTDENMKEILPKLLR